MLKAGFIGFGRMGITHFSILNTHPDVEIAAVCDSSRTMMSIFGQYTGVRTYTDHRKMLDSEQLDMVIISTPSASHAQLINECIDAGLHVFVEKPLALNTDEGRQILARLDGKDLVNQVGYVNRFNEVFVKVRDLLNAGVIGDMRSFSSDMFGATVLADTGSSWRGTKSAGGGAMYEFGSHCIDLVVYLLGQPQNVSGSVLQRVYSRGVEDIVHSHLVYPNGASGRVFVNWSDESYRKPANIIELFGTRGRIVADKHAFKIYLREANDEYGFHVGWNTRYITDFADNVRFYVRGNEFTTQLDHFVDCIQGKAQNLASFQQAFLTDTLMEEITIDAAQPARAIGGQDGPRPAAAPPPPASFWKRLLQRLRGKSHA